jgi:cell wall-associated NlpC family hydrolase
MALKGVSAPAVAAAGIGGLFLWSGLKGAKISTTARSLLQGQQPSAANANPISGNSFAGQFASGPLTASSSGNLGSGSGAAIASDALRYQGAGYVWGGAPAQGIGHWDCSSFANWVVGHDSGLAIPFYKVGGYNGSAHGPATVAWLGWGGCHTVGNTGRSAQPGDLCIWQTHMGIAIGGGQMISAQNQSSGTQISGIDGFVPELLFVRRLKAVG